MLRKSTAAAAPVMQHSWFYSTAKVAAVTHGHASRQKATSVSSSASRKRQLKETPQHRSYLHTVCPNHLLAVKVPCGTHVRMGPSTGHGVPAAGR